MSTILVSTPIWILWNLVQPFMESHLLWCSPDWLDSQDHVIMWSSKSILWRSGWTNQIFFFFLPDSTGGFFLRKAPSVSTVSRLALLSSTIQLALCWQRSSTAHLTGKVCTGLMFHSSSTSGLGLNWIHNSISVYCQLASVTMWPFTTQMVDMQ